MVGHWDTRRGRMRRGGQIVQYPRICASGVKNPFGERDLACALGYGQMVKTPSSILFDHIIPYSMPRPVSSVWWWPGDRGDHIDGRVAYGRDPGPLSGPRSCGQLID